jgi:hypothetical protein
MEWELTECDINMDIKVSDAFHFSAVKIQVRHLDHLFSIYVKSMGRDTVCRIEERKHPPTKTAIAFIDDIFNPYERIESKIDQIKGMMDETVGIRPSANNNHGTGIADVVTANREKRGGICDKSA